MNPENLTIYNQDGGYKSLGWNINNSILNSVSTGSLVVPAGLLYINNNFNRKQIKTIEKGVVNNDLFDSFYNFIEGKKRTNNKTKKRRKRKRKNKTRKY